MKLFQRSILLIPIILIFNIVIAEAQIERPIGINLAGIVDWSPEFVFVDIMKQSRNWIAHDNIPDAEWDSGVNIPLADNGYPLQLPYDNGVDPPQIVRTVMLTELTDVFPSGEYRLISEGQGRLQLWGAASVTLESPIDTLIYLDNSSEILAMELLESNVNDPIHNIRLVMPGFHNTFETNPFHPDLLDFLEDFQLIRFMDWMKTNGSELSHWSDRNSISNYTQTLDQGVAYEYLIQLCNLLKKDLWINVPHKATDNFISQFAQLLRDQVDPSLKIYIEYSNEVWNEIFSQNQYAAQAADSLGYTGDPWDLSWQYTARRSADMFYLFEKEFNNQDRLVKVIPGFSANPWVNNFILERFNNPAYNLNGVTADVLAIAPYFGSIANSIGEAGLENSISINAILDSMENSLPETYMYMLENKELADDYNLELHAYEGGQHLVAEYPYCDNESFVEKLLDANRDPRMEDMYCRYFEQWYETIGAGLFAHFSSHGGYSKFGAWGVKETFDDVNAPKYLALQNCVFNANIMTSTVQLNTVEYEIRLFPSRVLDKFIIEGAPPMSQINIFDVKGTLHKNMQVESFTQVTTEELIPGMYFVHVIDEKSNLITVLKFIKVPS